MNVERTKKSLVPCLYTFGLFGLTNIYIHIPTYMH